MRAVLRRSAEEVMGYGHRPDWKGRQDPEDLYLMFAFGGKTSNYILENILKIKPVTRGLVTNLHI